MTTPTPPLALPALKRAMQTLSDTIRHRFGAENARENIQRAMVDLQTVHVILSDRAGRGDAAGWVPIETAPKDMAVLVGGQRPDHGPVDRSDSDLC